MFCGIWDLNKAENSLWELMLISIENLARRICQSVALDSEMFQTKQFISSKIVLILVMEAGKSKVKDKET